MNVFLNFYQNDLNKLKKEKWFHLQNSTCNEIIKKSNIIAYKLMKRNIFN